MTLKFFSDTYILLKVDRFEGFVIRSEIDEFMINNTSRYKSRVTHVRIYVIYGNGKLNSKIIKSISTKFIYFMLYIYLTLQPNLTVIAPAVLEIYTLENHPVFFVFNKNSFHCRMTSLFYLLRCSVLLIRHNYLKPCTAVA